MKNLLKTLFVLTLFFATTSSYAQISAGGGLWYASDISTLGISIDGKYDFTEKLAVAPAFTYFLKKDGVNWSVLDLDANYAITEIENLGNLYALGGLAVTFWKVKWGGYDLGEFGEIEGGSTTGSDIGVNLGVGLNIAASEKFAIAPEVKYTISDGGYFRIGAKIMFGL